MELLAVVDLSPVYEEFLVCTSSFGIYICKLLSILYENLGLFQLLMEQIVLVSRK